MSDDRDNPGISVPPPLIYLLPLVLGSLLDRRRHIAAHTRGIARDGRCTLATARRGEGVAVLRGVPSARLGA
jgi:hypothetical protein